MWIFIVYLSNIRNPKKQLSVLISMHLLNARDCSLGDIAGYVLETMSVKLVYVLVSVFCH